MVTMRHVLTLLVGLWVVSSSNAEIILDIHDPSGSHKAHELHEHHPEFLPDMQKHPLVHHAHQLHKHPVLEEGKSLDKNEEINRDPRVLHGIHHHFPFQTGHGTSIGGGSGPVLMNGFGSGGTSSGGGSGGGAGGVGGGLGASLGSNPFGNGEGGGESLPGRNGDHPIICSGDGSGGGNTPPVTNFLPAGPNRPAAIQTPEPSGILMLALGSLLVGGSWLLRSRFQVAT